MFFEFRIIKIVWHHCAVSKTFCLLRDMYMSVVQELLPLRHSCSENGRISWLAILSPWSWRTLKNIRFCLKCLWGAEKIWKLVLTFISTKTEDEAVKMASQEYSQDKNRSRFEDIVRYANAQLNLYEELLNARTEKMRQIVSQLTDNFLKCFGPPSNPGVVHQAGIYLWSLDTRVSVKPWFEIVPQRKG